MEDLNAATLDDARAFFRTYYAPNNAVLALVGDFQTDVALALINTYFGGIPSQPPPPMPDLTEPIQMHERRKTIDDAFAQTPRLDIVYKTVLGNTPDFYALSVLGHILAGDDSARLHRLLVKELAIAVSVAARPDERRGMSLFWMTIVVRPHKSLSVVEELIYAELARLQRELVEDRELEKVHLKLRRQQAHNLYSTRFRANLLADYAVYYGAPELINTRLEHLARVTRGALQRVAHCYLQETNRMVVTTLPTPQAAPSTRSEQAPAEETP